jgi:membrane protease YdiL (CAAX protease family)
MTLIQAAFVAAYFVAGAVSRRGGPPELLSAEKARKLLPAALAPVFALCSILAFYAPALWFAAGLDAIGFVSPQQPRMSTPLEFTVGCFLLLVAAPLVEEVIFRGALLSGLRTRYGAKTAVLMSAAAFMIMHMNPEQTAYQFLFGIVLGAVALRTGSIAAPVVMHSFSNLFALLLDYTALGARAEAFVAAVTAEAWLAALASAGFVAAFGAALFVLTGLAGGKKGASGELTLESRPLAVKPVPGKNGEVQNVGFGMPQRTDGAGGGPRAAQENGRPRRAERIAFCTAAGIGLFMWLTVLAAGIAG